LKIIMVSKSFSYWRKNVPQYLPQSPKLLYLGNESYVNVLRLVLLVLFWCFFLAALLSVCVYDIILMCYS
jgi:hypothetical protein